MPTITIKNGKRELKLSKRECDQMLATVSILEDVILNFYTGNTPRQDALEAARQSVLGVIEHADEFKPVGTRLTVEVK